MQAMKLNALFGIAFAALAVSAFPTLVEAQSQTGGTQKAGTTRISGKVVRVGDGDFVLDTGKGQVLLTLSPLKLRL